MAVPPPPLGARAATVRTDDKAALRARLRAARKAHVAALGPDALARSLSIIGNRIHGLIHDGARAIGGYAAQRAEPAIFEVLSRLREDGHPVALPRAGADGAMRFVGWRPGDRLLPGLAGIAEPPDGEEMVPDTLLVPLVGFDRAGRRLGQGGGHYDRWLARHPHARAIGVAWSVQEAPAMPTDPWDVPLALIVTERETILP